MAARPLLQKKVTGCCGHDRLRHRWSWVFVTYTTWGSPRTELLCRRCKRTIRVHVGRNG